MTFIKAPFPSEIARYLQRVGSRKRTCRVRFEIPSIPLALRSMWDGGSRDVWTCYRNDERIHIPVSGSYFEVEKEGFMPKVGDVLIRSGTTQGKESIPSITFFVAKLTDDAT